METTDGHAESQGDVPEEEEERPTICAYGTSEERTVFTESGNGDGWISTDLIVEPTK